MKTYYLEMTDAHQHQPSQQAMEGFRIEQAQIPYGALNRFFYHVVGAAWGWRVRLSWTDAEWQANAKRSGLETWTSYVDSGCASGWTVAFPVRSCMSSSRRRSSTTWWVWRRMPDWRPWPSP